MPPKKADPMLTKPRFDWSFNLGHVFTVLAIAGGAISYIISNARMQTENNMRLLDLEKKSNMYIPLIDNLRDSNINNNNRMDNISQSIQADRANTTETFKAIRIDLSDVNKNVANIRESNARMESTLNSILRSKP